MKPTPMLHWYFPVSQRDQNWGLHVTTVGEMRSPPDTMYPPGGHPEGYAFDWQHGRILDEFAFVYISSGRGKFESKPHFSSDIEPGHVLLLFPGVWHRYRPAPETGWHEHWIGFDGSIARQWQTHHFFSAKNPVLKIHAEDAVLAIFSHIMQSIRANRPALQQIVAGATANLLGLFYSAQHQPAATETHSANAIELAITRIQSDYARDLDMKILAQELGVSYSWFRSTFAAHTGLSPHHYLLEFRLVCARNLLAGTGLSVKEIAMRTGFQDEHYFSRLFREKINLTPSQWRRKSQRQP